MLKNYFKLAIKVLARRKFFTFISLFGISFTLMILMLITAFLQNELGDNKPISQKDNMVFLPQLIMTKEVIDTVPKVDSTLIDGTMRYDTTYEYVDRRPSYSSSSFNFNFLDRHLRKLDGTRLESFYQPNSTFDVFVNGNKLAFDAIYTDAAYWSVYDFNLEDGRTYQPQQVKNQEPVAVITDKAAVQYFGTGKNIIGERITLEDKQYEIIGVVQHAQTNRSTVSADVYLPLTHANGSEKSLEDYFGGFEAVFLADKSAYKDRIKEDIQARIPGISLPNPEDYNKITLQPMTFMERYARSIAYDENPRKSLRLVFGILAGLLSLFILLPTLNLVNLNISRILERSSEIGVRKAFGAHSGNILFQFVFENIILTFVGGLIGLALAAVLLYVINDSRALGDTFLRFNLSIFVYSFFICLGFGIISGIIPAYRMSKLQIANALKQNQL